MLKKIFIYFAVLSILLCSLNVGTSYSQILMMLLLQISFIVINKLPAANWLCLILTALQLPILFLDEIRLMYFQYYLPILLIYACLILEKNIKKFKGEFPFVFSCFLLVLCIINQVIVTALKSNDTKHSAYFLTVMIIVVAFFASTIVMAFIKKREQSYILIICLALLHMVINLIFAPVDDSIILPCIFPTVLLLWWADDNEDFILKKLYLKCETLFQSNMSN